MLITENDFEYIDPTDNSSNTKIKINANNHWKGVVFELGQLTVSEINDETEEATMTFDFDVLSEGQKELENDPNFQEYVGSIINFILDRAFETGDYRIGGNDD